MNFLEAAKLKNKSSSYKSIEIGFYMSGLSTPVEIYLQGFFSKNNLNVILNTVEFGTLAQKIISNKLQKENIIVILPWDLIPELDWRSGVPIYKNTNNIKMQLIEQLEGLGQTAIFYIPAPIPPVLIKEKSNIALEEELTLSMINIGAKILPRSFFSLKNYLNTGCPIHVRSYSIISDILTNSFLSLAREKIKKVIITDFDGVLWSGIIGDDGVGSIQYSNDSKGFPHYIFQTFLKNLKERGILLCGVTKNNLEVATQPFSDNRMILNDDDFVSILASYNPKSAQIKLLSDELNLRLDSFVFIDDNLLEITEVSRAIPDVKCILFPNEIDDLPKFMREIFSLFKFKNITSEDNERTELYKRRLKGLAPVEESSITNIFDFLKDLDMTMSIYNKSYSDWTRALQLINKTNQFNMNGNKISNDQVKDIVNNGGHIFSVILDDKTGSHGEVLSFLIDKIGNVKSFVMSCRVFQREIEYFFLEWILNHYNVSNFEYTYTGKNDVFKKNIANKFFDFSENNVTINSDGLSKYMKQFDGLLKITIV